MDMTLVEVLIIAITVQNNDVKQRCRITMQYNECI